MRFKTVKGFLAKQGIKPAGVDDHLYRHRRHQLSFNAAVPVKRGRGRSAEGRHAVGNRPADGR